MPDRPRQVWTRPRGFHGRLPRRGRLLRPPAVHAAPRRDGKRGPAGVHLRRVPQRVARVRGLAGHAEALMGRPEVAVGCPDVPRPAQVALVVGAGVARPCLAAVRLPGPLLLDLRGDVQPDQLRVQLLHRRRRRVPA